MSVDVVSRIVAMIALDGNLLASFLPVPDLGEDNETRRRRFLQPWVPGGLLEGDEVDLLATGTFDEIFTYIEAHLDKPVREDEWPPG